MAASRHNADESRNSMTLRLDLGVIITSVLLIIVAIISWVGVINYMMSMQAMPADIPASATEMAATDMSETDMSVMDMPETDMAGMDMSEADTAEMEMPDTASPAAILPSGFGFLWSDAIAFLLAWGVMMAAMMLPSATPMIAMYGVIYRNRSKAGNRALSTFLFALVYVAVWLAFGVPVYLGGLIVDALARAYPVVANFLPYALGLTLIAAGAFQFSSLKQVCLRACQSPFMFLLGHWYSGYSGTLRMAFEHAIYCIGCCWGLMVVLVAAGAMALHWTLLIAVVVFAEKILPRPYGDWAARIVGGGLVLLGLLVIFQPNLAAVLRGPGM